MYSASQVESATIICLFEAHKIDPPDPRNIYPPVDFFYKSISYLIYVRITLQLISIGVNKIRILSYTVDDSFRPGSF